MTEMSVGLRLLLACEDGDLEIVKNCVEIGGANEIAQDDHKQFYRMSNASRSIRCLYMVGASPLFIAVLNKRIQIIHYLVGHWANVSGGLPSSDKDAGLTVLHAAFFSFEPHLDSSEQLDMIRCLVKAGANPSALSSKGLPIWMMRYGTELESKPYSTWYNPKAIRLLVELGMSVTLLCPDGRTLLHYLAGSVLMDDTEVFNLLLEKGADVIARDNDGITPIMAAAIGNNKIPNISILKFLLERKDITNMDKIDALELAAAILLSCENDHIIPINYIFDERLQHDSHHEDICDFLVRAKNLRRQENCPLTPEEEKNGLVVESFTSFENFEHIKQRPLEYQIQSILIRLRIFESVSLGAICRYLMRLIEDYHRHCRRTKERSFSQILDILRKVLEMIRRKNERTASVALAHMIFYITLDNLNRCNDPLFDTETLKPSMDLIDETYQVVPPVAEAPYYLESFYDLLWKLNDLPDALRTQTVKAFVRNIVSEIGRDWHGRTLIHIAIKELYDHEVSERVEFLLRNGANADAVDRDGNGAIHLLAMKSMQRYEGYEAVGRLLVMYGAHLDRANSKGKTAADIWREYMEGRRRRYHNHVPFPDDRPEWLNEGVPQLKCLAARVARRLNLHLRVLNDVGLPKLHTTLVRFVECHRP